MALPTGTVTFLFADIEGSTRLLQQLGDRYAVALADYRRLFRDAAEAHGGQEVDMPGDACFFAFSRATDAVAAAVAAQIALQAHPWPDGRMLRARIGVHTGEPFAQDRNYVGLDVHRAARICAAAHGGQVVLSDATRVFVEQALPEGVVLRDLGEHRLKDLQRPERLYAAVHAQLPQVFPPLRTLDARPNNLPLLPTQFVGRDEELVSLHQMLQDGAVRLITLTGPGGTGKTRLALQLAAAAVDEFPHGVYFVPLSHVNDSEMIIPAVARALDLGEQKDQPLQEALAQYLKDRRLLVVLDNLEQVPDSGPLIHSLLAGCPGVKIVATSRERVRVSWEHEFPIPPLPTPQAGSSLAAQLASPAIALFIDRARMVQPGFTLTAENTGAVAEICAGLDGLPLAIELAAARVKLLPVREIARRLQDQLRLLRGGPVDAPERHRSLQAAMLWSYALLSPAEQRLFRRLAVFRGGCALDSAEAVCRDLDDDVFTGLASLVDKSLLRQVHSQDDRPRFLMLETIRQFGLERLAAEDDLEDATRRHAEHFADLAEQLEAAIPADDEHLADRMWRDADNMRAAADWAMHPGRPALAVRLGAGLGWAFYMRGQLTEGRERLARLMRIAPGPPDGPTGARTMLAAGVLAWSTGDTGPAQAWLSEALEYFVAHGDRRREAVATAFLGHVARTAGDLEQAAARYEQAHTTYRALGHASGIAWTLHDLGQIARDRGTLDEATALEEQSLAAFRQRGDRWGAAWALWNLGVTAHRQGNDTGARAHYIESLELYRALDDRRGIAQCLEGLAAIAFVTGRLEESLQMLAAVESLRTTAGAPAVADRTEYDRTLEALRAGLSTEAFDRAWTAGSRLEPSQAIALALQASEPPPAAPARRTRRRSGLTAREEEVAALVARGLSNREIASTLSVAERTAVSHIEHIMNKLSLHSRAQIAVWAVREGLDR